MCSQTHMYAYQTLKNRDREGRREKRGVFIICNRGNKGERKRKEEAQNTEVIVSLSLSLSLSLSHTHTHTHTPTHDTLPSTTLSPYFIVSLTLYHSCIISPHHSSCYYHKVYLFPKVIT